ncbi:hypothetical protein [Leptolyngbya iicbica]|uniref:Uncharacterized protein n=2 Tax=Cyanophyceae TaxID=3028117 RepID=A0A4V2E1S2_9CYAN|nr:hypothetical protein [Leptolyngbya sp. LK]RZM75043.1 hypothetical protein DYY88_22290 [Leptolyngbya sp. LK]
MRQTAVDLFQLLVEAGAVPGQDFSCDAEQAAFHLNERCYDLLQAAFPQVDWSDVLGAPQAGVQHQIEALHEALGSHFVDQLVALMVSRLTALADDEAAGYVQAILVGVESATGIAIFPFLQAALDWAGQARLEWLLRQTAIAIPGELCLQDLLQAAGATSQDYETHAGELWLTEAGWQRLALVWDGECTLGTRVEALPPRSPKQF